MAKTKTKGTRHWFRVHYSSGVMGDPTPKTDVPYGENDVSPESLDAVMDGMAAMIQARREAFKAKLGKAKKGKKAKS